MSAYVLEMQGQMFAVAQNLCNTLPTCPGYIGGNEGCCAAPAAQERAVRGVLQGGVARRNFGSQGCCKIFDVGRQGKLIDGANLKDLRHLQEIPESSPNCSSQESKHF